MLVENALRISHLAMRVFPFPGGPTSSTPLGALAPEERNFSGLRKKSTISSSSTWRRKTHKPDRSDN